MTACQWSLVGFAIGSNRWRKKQHHQAPVSIPANINHCRIAMTIRGAGTLCQDAGITRYRIRSFQLYLADVPETVVKFSGIGCSSKSLCILNGAGFNGSRRMPSLAGRLFMTPASGVSVSSDSDSEHWHRSVLTHPSQPADGVSSRITAFTA